MINHILLISPEPWNAHTVSKHHYALTLSQQGFTVYFLNPFDNVKKKLEINKIKERLYVITSPKIATGLRYYPVFLRHWIEKRWLIELEKKVGIYIDTIWLFENSRFFDLRFVGKRLKIYHQVDLNQNFNLSLASKTADICFCTSTIIRNKIIGYNRNTYKIHHGLAETKQGKLLTDKQIELFKKKYINCVYIGNLEMLYLDAELLANIVSKSQNIQFHFIGGYKIEGKLYKLTQQLPNIYWWGKVDSILIPEILKYSNVLLVTYQEAHYQDQSSPHKFMEYFASGKVVVATYTDEYKDKHYLLEMVDHNKNYYNAFQRVINNLDYYNSSEKQQQRIAFAQAHTYEKQLEKIFALLKKHQLI